MRSTERGSGRRRKRRNSILLELLAADLQGFAQAALSEQSCRSSERMGGINSLFNPPRRYLVRTRPGAIDSLCAHVP
jgi:hypothetical protein